MSSLWCFSVLISHGAYGALSVNSRKTAISVTTPVAVDFGYSTLLSHHYFSGFLFDRFEATL